MSTINQHGRIVVGVAPCNSNRAALAFAMREASLRGSTLEIITAWQWDIDSDTLTLKQPFDVAGDAEAGQVTAISRALEATTTRPAMCRRVLEGDPGTELCSSARYADLLVVGATHKNMLKRLLLGSVSQFCLRHAPCPVVVVPEVRTIGQPVELPPAARCRVVTTQGEANGCRVGAALAADHPPTQA